MEVDQPSAIEVWHLADCVLQFISMTLLWIACPEKYPLQNFCLIFHLLCKQESCQHVWWSVFSVTSSLFAVHSFCLRCIPAHYVILPNFVSTNRVALLETINQFSTFWEMTYRLLLWKGRAGCDRKVLQPRKKDQEVSLQIRITKANFTFTSWSMWSRFFFILLTAGLTFRWVELNQPLVPGKESHPE